MYLGTGKVTRIAIASSRSGQDKPKLILYSDWLPKQPRWYYLAPSGLPTVSLKKKGLFAVSKSQFTHMFFLFLLFSG